MRDPWNNTSKTADPGHLKTQVRHNTPDPVICEQSPPHVPEEAGYFVSYSSKEVPADVYDGDLVLLHDQRYGPDPEIELTLDGGKTTLDCGWSAMHSVERAGAVPAPGQHSAPFAHTVRLKALLGPDAGLPPHLGGQPAVLPGVLHWVAQHVSGSTGRPAALFCENRRVYRVPTCHDDDPEVLGDQDMLPGGDL